MKERLAVFININPLKKEIRLQKVDMITELGNKNNKRKKKKKGPPMASFLLQVYPLASWEIGWRLLW